MKKEMLQVLNEVVEHFSKNPKALRSVGKTSRCYYKPLKSQPESTGCAIGMFMTAEQKDTVKYKMIGVYDLKEQNPKLIPEKLKNFPIEFLTGLQMLHDDGHNWNNDGLSITGIKEVEKIKNYIENYRE